MIDSSSQSLKCPWRVTFDTNPDLCNLNCIMCEERSPYRKDLNKVERIMDFEIINNVLENTVNLGLKEIIPSTMGEPLLYPKFKNLIELVKKYDLNLNLTTNGTFPKLGVKRWGELILPVASDVKISINGSSEKTAENIMTGLNFKEHISNIRKFIEIRDNMSINGVDKPTVTFQVTYMESNLAELPDILKLAMEMGADRFKGHHLWITWPELEKESLLRDPDSRKRWNNTVNKLNKIVNYNESTIRLDNVYQVPLNSSEYNLPFNFICPFLGREAWISWKGTFNVCCSPDNLRKSLGYFGNIKERNVMDLWNDNNYNELVRNWGGYEICRKCNMRRPKDVIGGC